MSRIKDLRGQWFGDLRPLQSKRVAIGKQQRFMVYWTCECSCGNKADVLACHLTSGKIRSCGCLKTRRARDGTHWNRRHGKGGTAIYRVWWSMISRCTYPKLSNYKYYGGRGIRVCDRWRYGEGGKSGVECFILDMGQRPDGMSIERWDNSGNYEPGNCYWATHSEQMAHSWRDRALTPSTGR